MDWSRTLAVALAATLIGPCANAFATVSDAAPVDGPSADILELDGVAMAEDGTGGLVYRKKIDGIAHIFAARYANGVWQPAQQVDVGQRFASSFPAIAAADDGELVVVWV
jgi:hypothetical protein